MVKFEEYLKKYKEIGFIKKISQSIVYVEGLPGINVSEIVIFENDLLGQVYSVDEDYVEVLILSKGILNVGLKVARTNNRLRISVGEHLLGKTFNPIDMISMSVDEKKSADSRYIDTDPPGLSIRRNVSAPFVTGVTVIDLVLPLGKGQRELVIGDRKTNKTQFLLQCLHTQALFGTICIYTSIAKRRADIASFELYFKDNKIINNTIMIATNPDEQPGLVYLTPYVAMSVAEYFRDQGKNVFVVFDDLSAHAKYYREISLMSGRFPGRNSYPGDIFYIHSRLLERAGNFGYTNNGKESEVSITCMPIAEMVMGDLSGYIQTNLMAMTDGHIFFDRDYFNQGRRPPINPFLSVTRVGRQAQSNLSRELTTKLTSFLVKYEKLKEFMHFGAELSEETQKLLLVGNKITNLLEQFHGVIIPYNLSVIMFSMIWSGYWNEKNPTQLKNELLKVDKFYRSNPEFRKYIDDLIEQSNTFSTLIDKLKNNQMNIYQYISNVK
ncbi:MAG TPA: hypothetical protein VI819_03750 [Patescibacteria group bacterium]|nr:hypothetical protein [Patescibacteria group bacterium]